MNKSKLRYCVHSLLFFVHENVNIFAKRTREREKEKHYWKDKPTTWFNKNGYL